MCKDFLLDIDCTDKDTKDTALAISHTLKYIWPSDVLIHLMGQCTDSGGGGTLHILEQELAALGLCHE